MEKILFKEEQKFGQWWIWLILLIAFAVSGVPIWDGLILQVTTGQPWGDNPSSNGVLALIASLTTLLIFGIFLLFKNMRLLVEIYGNGILEIGKAYNVTGNIGLRLFLKSGKIILLGSQRAQALSYAMEKLMRRDTVPD